ncbi:MAG TPA: ATP-binding protein [Spirochaetota bacterium]|nr:ATP-binding protein [Spirochaetota bacterium]HPS86542.1 ATP-binding protein [Spirochaetota bacterium]
MKGQEKIIRTSRYIILLGCSCFLIYSVFTLVSYFYGIDRLNRDLRDNIFPKLTERVDARIELFFKPTITGLSLLSETLDWPVIMQKAASDPRWLKSNMKAWAEELDINSVGISDRYRKIVWDYWSDKPITLDPALPRDGWFFDFWKRPSIPDWTFTLYSENLKEDYQLYIDRIIYDKNGRPIGSIAGQIPLSRLSNQFLQIIKEGERIIILDDQGNAVVDISFRGIVRGARLFGIDYSSKDNSKSGEALFIKKILSQSDDYGHLEEGGRNIYYKRTSLFNGTMPILTIMDTGYHLQKERSRLIKELMVLFVSFILFIGGALMIMMLFTQRLKSLAIKFEMDRSKFEDLLFIVTHGFGNEILLLQKYIAEIPRKFSAGIDLHLSEISLMIQNSVNAARLGSVRDLIIFKPYNFSWQWGKLIDNYKPLSTRKGQAFYASPAIDCIINNDEEMVYQILANLISNAIKYAPLNGAVKVDSDTRGDLLFVTVSDSGPGFLPEDCDELFSKFKKLSAKTSGGERSTGLGLYIVKQLADACNIKLTLSRGTGELHGAVWELEFKIVQSGI